MPRLNPENPSHRAWIEHARAQSEEADRQAATVTPAGAPADAAPLSPDYFPGYELQREIHRGAQGVVYRAVQKSTGRRVAVKLLHDHALGGPHERARFEREMRVLAALKHANVVAIHDGGNHDGRFFLVMDYIAGQTLDVYMAGRSHTIRRTLELFGQICEAVNAAHVRGIIHRDIKPANVRVDESGRPFVLDFGLAKLTAEARDDLLAGHGSAGGTLTGQFLGSLPWAAPEQVDGNPEKIDIRTDVYSLGVLLYQMLTGKFPYPVSGPMKTVMEAVVNAAPRPPGAVRRGIDDELETIVLKALSKQRERRYQTAGELGSDVRRYLAGEPIEAKRESALYLMRKTMSRHRVALAVVAGFLILLVGSSVVAWTLSVQARRSAESARRAEVAARTSEEVAMLRLRDSLIAQARVTRHSGQMGQRFDALEALKKAAAIQPTVEARSEAISAMALPDLRLVRQLRHAGGTWRDMIGGWFDNSLERCAIVADDQTINVVRTEDDSILARIPAPEGGCKELHTVTLAGRFLLRLFDPPAGDRRLEVWNLDPSPAARSNTMPAAVLHFKLDDVPFLARHSISRDGKRLAVGRTDQAIHIFDLESAQEVQRLPLDRNAPYLSFDPSGRRLALYHAGFARAGIMDLQTGLTEPAFESQDVTWSVAWHPEGNLLAGATGTRVELYDLETRRARGLLVGHQHQVVHAQFSHDGRLLVTYSWEGTSFLWDVLTLRPLLQFGAVRPALSANDHRIGCMVAMHNQYQLEILELDTALERCRLVGTGADPDQVDYCHGAFDPVSGLLLVVDPLRTPDGGLWVFDPAAADASERARFACEPMGWLAIDPHGKFVLTGHKRGVSRWPLRRDDAPRRDSRQGGAAHIGPPQPIFDSDSACSVELSADGTTGVVSTYSDDEFAVLDLQSGGPPHRFSCPAQGVRISPDGRWAATGRFGGTGGEVWDLKAQTRVAQLPLVGDASMRFHPNGRWLVSMGTAGASVWDVGTWQLVKQVATPRGWLAFSPDGRIAAISDLSATVHLVDGVTFELIATLEPPESYYTQACAFSPDGSLLAQFTSRAGMVHLWNLRRIRTQLSAMGLDWDAPPCPPATPHDRPPPMVVLHCGDQDPR